MPRQNVETAAMNYVGLRQVVDDFIITMDGDDYVSNVSDVAIRNIALRGIREFGFDVTNRVRSLKLSVESNNTVTLPDDYVDLIKIGIVTDGIVYVLGENKNLNMSMAVVTGSDAGVGDSQDGPLDIQANEIADRDRSVEDTAGTSGDGDKDYDYYVFQNYLYQGGLGRLYGAGGGHLRGEYRIDLDQNRIEMSTEDAISEVVLEYVADEARNTFPVIHVYAEESRLSLQVRRRAPELNTTTSVERPRVA
jgi:hypothetical protein